MRAEAWAEAPKATTPVLSVVATFDGGKEERVAIVQAGDQMFALRAGEPGAARLTAPAVTDVIALLDPAKAAASAPPAPRRPRQRQRLDRSRETTPRPPRNGRAVPHAWSDARHVRRRQRRRPASVPPPSAASRSGTAAQPHRPRTSSWRPRSMRASPRPRRWRSGPSASSASTPVGRGGTPRRAPQRRPGQPQRRPPRPSRVQHEDRHARGGGDAPRVGLPLPHAPPRHRHARGARAARRPRRDRRRRPDHRPRRRAAGHVPRVGPAVARAGPAAHRGRPRRRPVAVRRGVAGRLVELGRPAGRVRRAVLGSDLQRERRARARRSRRQRGRACRRDRVARRVRAAPEPGGAHDGSRTRVHGARHARSRQFGARHHRDDAHRRRAGRSRRCRCRTRRATSSGPCGRRWPKRGSTCAAAPAWRPGPTWTAPHRCWCTSPRRCRTSRSAS